MARTLAQQLAAVGPGDHLCLIYEARAEQMAAAVPFLEQGLRRDECCMYIADERTAAEVIEALAAAGVAVERERQRGALVLLSTRESYLRGGTFEPDAMIELLHRTTDEALANGFSGFRVVVEMTWTLGAETGSERLVEYEARLNRFFPERRAAAICQYHRGPLPPGVIRPIIRNHPLIVVGDRVCSDNPYYQPPELVLGGGDDGQRVDWMLGQLSRIRATEQALEESRAELQAILDNSTAAIYVKDAEGRYLVLNRHIEQLAGRDRADILGKTDREVFAAEFAEAFEANDREILTGGRPLQREETIERDGETRTYLSVKFPLLDAAGRPRAVGGISADITERKQIERERIDLLAREQAARAVSEAARAVAEAAVRARDEFLSIASHELRTPLTTLQAHAQMLLRRLERGGSIEPAVLERSLRAITQQGAQLASLVTQLLDVSRIEAGQLTLDRQTVDLTALAERVASDAQARTGRSEITVRGPAGLTALVDPLRLEQVLTNLVDNAVKYGAEDGAVELTLGVGTSGSRSRVVSEAGDGVGTESLPPDPQLPTPVWIAVRDHGAGVPSDERERIFERFYRAHAETHSSGMGLGLYISRQIVELHGGTLTAEFPEDGGTRFVIRLPTGVADGR